MTIEEAFGAVIRRLRKERRLSQEDLSLSSSLGRAFISQLERGKQQPTLVTIFELAKALSVSASRILTELELLLQFNNQQQSRCTQKSKSSSSCWINSKGENMSDHCAGFKGDETILLVDDELHLREMLRELLTEFGYSVLEAKDGQEAVETYRELSQTINMILMDVMMPRKDGIMAKDEILDINPEAIVLLMSAYTSDHLGNIENLNFIQKPMQSSELLRNIRQMLDGSQ